jgi:hypothetical protein
VQMMNVQAEILGCKGATTKNRYKVSNLLIRHNRTEMGQDWASVGVGMHRIQQLRKD